MFDSARKWVHGGGRGLMGPFFDNKQKGKIIRAIISGVHGVRTFRGVKAFHGHLLIYISNRIVPLLSLFSFHSIPPKLLHSIFPFYKKILISYHFITALFVNH